MLPAQKPSKSQSSAQSVNNNLNHAHSSEPPSYQEPRRNDGKPSKFLNQKPAPAENIEQSVNPKGAPIGPKAPPPYFFSKKARFQGLFSGLRSQPSQDDFSRESFGSSRPDAVKGQSQKAATFSGETLSNASK